MGLRSWLGLSTHTGPASPLAGPSHLERAVWVELLDATEHEADLTRAEAMAIPALAKARHVIAGQVGRVPIVASSPTGEWVRQPEPWRAPSLTYAWTADHMLWWGAAWWHVIARDASGRPSAVEVVSPDRLAMTHDVITLDGRPIAWRDLIRIDGPHEGLLTSGQRVLKAARALYRATGRALDNPVPSVELHQTQGDPLSRDQVDTLVKSWAAARRGANGGVAFTNQAVEVKTHGQAAEQLLLGARQMIATEIAQLAGLSAWAVDASVEGTSITYSNTTSRMRELLDFTLAPYLDAIAGRLSMDDLTPRGTRIRWATETLTSPDFGERMTGYAAAIAAGVYTAEECRQIETSGRLPERTT